MTRLRSRLSKILCALFGHPPVVDICIGQVTCARCHEILGDKLAGTYPTEDKAIVGHECDTCWEIWGGLTLREKILTKSPAHREEWL